MKRLLLIVLTLFLLGGSVGAVSFQDAMNEGDSPTKESGTEGLFPSWAKEDHPNMKNIFPQVAGVLGTNKDEGGKTEKLLMAYIPHLIDVLLKFVAPLIMVGMLYAGVRFIYAGSNEEELSQAKEIFTYTLMGAVFVVLSYSIMKALYFLLST